MALRLQIEIPWPATTVSMAWSYSLKLRAHLLSGAERLGSIWPAVAGHWRQVGSASGGSFGVER